MKNLTFRSYTLMSSGEMSRFSTTGLTTNTYYNRSEIVTWCYHKPYSKDLNYKCCALHNIYLGHFFLTSDVICYMVFCLTSNIQLLKPFYFLFFNKISDLNITQYLNMIFDINVVKYRLLLYIKFTNFIDIFLEGCG